MVTLNVLDQSPIRAGGSAQDAIRETLELAEAADRLGYKRYWLAEHHSSGMLAGASPEILIGQVAARTKHLRVGSGGVMLSHYSALKVAEQFRMLETLFPGRIDLGIGRAPGSDGRTAQALAHGPGTLSIEYFPDQLMDVYGFLYGDLPHDHPFYGIRAMPAGPSAPELWLLGSSATSGEYASQFGWAFCFAHFINSEGGARVVRDYMHEFRPSPMLDAPKASVAVSVTCADTFEEAERLSWSRWGVRVRPELRDRGVQPPDALIGYPYSPSQLQYIESMKSRTVYGNPQQVKEQLLELGEQYAVDEFVLVTITYDFAARVHSYELIADAFGLTPGT